MAFSLKTLPFGTTLARQIAKQNLTTFNNVFWVAERSRAHLRGGFSSIRFPAAGPGVHGIFKDAGEWTSAVDEFRTWSRQHVLVSAASLLEVYVKQVAMTALTAMPELFDRTMIGVDGFKFVLGRASPPKNWKKLIEARTDGFVVGDWEGRLRKMEMTFGGLPPTLVALGPSLDKIQKKRNRIVHDFGTEGARLSPWDSLTRIDVGKAECADAIKSVSAFIQIADENVFAPVIGGHEVLQQYHDWSKKQKNLRHMRVSGTVASAFNDHIGGQFGRPLGSVYVRELIAYYEAL